jgi:hypothetical protein
VEGKKKGVRGPLKGHSAAIKRVKSGCHKLRIQFSTRLGGPVGINHSLLICERSDDVYKKKSTSHWS